MTVCATASDRPFIRIAGIVPESIVDGPGLRMTIFTQGCPHHCPGCHNPETHSRTDGYLKAPEDVIEEYRANPLLSGITFSGGEPFLQAGLLAPIARQIHILGGDVVTYTGYYLEELLELGKRHEEMIRLLEETDLLVDGPFEENRKSLELSFRGSFNQRLLYKYDFCSFLETGGQPYPL